MEAMRELRGNAIQLQVPVTTRAPQHMVYDMEQRNYAHPHYANYQSHGGPDGTPAYMNP